MCTINDNHMCDHICPFNLPPPPPIKPPPPPPPNNPKKSKFCKN